MNSSFTVSREYLGRTIAAEVLKLDDGYSVSLFGGERTHVGAVAYCSSAEKYSFSPKGHKELEIAEKWAESLSKAGGCPVTVTAGIHYDNLNKVQIMEIVMHTEDMLSEILHLLNISV